jgi:hypothetical protein
VTGRDRRAMILGGGVLLAAFLVLRGFPWGVRSALAAATDLRERAELLAHALEEVAEAPELRDSAARITQALGGLASRLLNGASAAEAGADLSAQVNLAATRHSAKVERLEVLADSARAGRLGRARVHVVLETDVRGLVALLRSIAESNAALVVQELRVIAPDPASADRVPEVLKVELMIYGWYPRPA